MPQTIRKANPGSDFLYVLDTPPKLNAMANCAAVKRYERKILTPISSSSLSEEGTSMS